MMNDPITPAPGSAPQSLDPGQVSPATPTLQVDPSKLKAVSITLGLAIVAVISGTTTVIGFLKARDIAGLVAWFQTEPAIPYFAGIATVATLIAMGWRTALRKAKEIYLAYHVKDRIAVVDVATPPKPPV